MEGPLRVSLNPIFVDGKDYPPGTTPPMRRTKWVSPGYFGALGTRLIAGRDITWSDIYGRSEVAIVSENFAREVWGSPAAALGHRIRESAPASTDLWREIVGGVENVHEDALYQVAPTVVYWPVMMENFGDVPFYPGRVPASVAPVPGVHRLASGRVVTVNVDPRESSVSVMTPEQFAEMLEPVHRGVEQVPARDEQTEGRQNLWQYGLILMLVALVAESFVGRA